MTSFCSGILQTVDQCDIHYHHYQNAHQKVIIIVHGFFISKQAPLFTQLVESLMDQSDVIIFDLRGHGKSQGTFSWTSKEHLDLLAVLEYARQYYPKIGVVGFSLGAAVSMITAAKTSLIHSLVSVSAPMQLGKIEYHFWQFNFENDILYNLLGPGRIGKGVRPGPFWLKKEKPIAVVKTLTIPILYIHGEADWLVKPRHSKELYQNTRALKRLCMIPRGPHAEHMLRRNKEELVSLIKEWFKTTL